MLNKKGQVTIFIIVGVLIVASIILFFIWKGDKLPQLNKGLDEENPDAFLETCLEGEIKEVKDILLAQGGKIDNGLSQEFQFEEDTDYSNLTYLCYNQNYYHPCITQEPMLIQKLKSEIEGYIGESVQNCFDSLVQSFQDEGYAPDITYTGFEVNFLPGKIVTDIDAEIILTRNEETIVEKDFEIFTSSKLYDLAVVAQEIMSQEARFCNFDHLGYMVFEEDFDIDKLRTADSTLIYSVKHKKAGERFNFAIRSCAIPPGI